MPMEEIATEVSFEDSSRPCNKEEKGNETQCGPNFCLHHEGMPMEEIATEVLFEDSSRPCNKEEKGNETQCGPNFCLHYEGTLTDVLQENGTISKQSMLALCPRESSFPDFHLCDFKQPPPPYNFACEVASKRPQGAAYLGGVELSDDILGQGSYGAVIAATHWNLKVAAKSIHPFLQVSPHSIRQFENECETLRNITHPNIVQFMGIYKPDDDTSAPYLIMELMKGGSLYQLVDTLHEGLITVSLQQKINIMLDIALALSYLHNERKITHRDLSSSNVLLTKDLKAKVSDLGMSRPFTTPYNQPSTLAPGCLSYMPPESLVQGSQFSPPGDIFSFGIISIELMIEEHPRPTRAVRVSEVERRKRDLCDFELAPVSLQDLIIPCLRDNPEERPTSNDIASRLQELMDLSNCDSGESSIKRYNSNPCVGKPQQVSNPQAVASPLFPSCAQGSFLHAEDVPFSSSESQQETMPFAAEVGTRNLLEQNASPLTSNGTQGPYVYGNQIITSLPIPTHESEQETAEESEQHSSSHIMQESQKDVGKLVAGAFKSNANEAHVEEDEESDYRDSCRASDSHDTSNNYDHSFLSAVSEETTLCSEQCSIALNCQHLPTQYAQRHHCLLTEYPQLAQGNFTNFQCQATHSNSVVSFSLALNSRCSQIKQVSRCNVHPWILDIMMKKSIANTTLCVNNFKMFMDLRVFEAAFNQMSYVFQHVQCFNSQPGEPLLDKNKTSAIIPMLKPPFSCANSNVDPASVSFCSTVIAKSSTMHNFHSKTYIFSAVFFQASVALYSNCVITSAFFCSTVVSKNSVVYTFQAKSTIIAIFQAKSFLYSHSAWLLVKAVLFISLEMTSASRFRYILVEKVLWYLPYEYVIPLLDEQQSRENVTSAIDYWAKYPKNGHLYSLMHPLILTSEDHIASIHRVCLMAKLKLFSLLLIYSFSQTTSCCKGSSPSCAHKKNLALSAVRVSEVSILHPNESKMSCHDCPPLTHTTSPVCLDGFKGLESLILHCLHSHHKVSGNQITDSRRMYHIAKRKLYWLICSPSHHQTTSRFNSNPLDESKISLALQGPSRFDVSPLNLKQPNLDLKGPYTSDVSEAPLLNFKQPGKIKSYLVLTHMHFRDCQSLIPHYMHSCHIEGGDQITGVHLIDMLKLYLLINSPLYHQSTSCFNKAPSRLALQETGFNIFASVNWKFPQNSHYETIGDEIMGMHMMYMYLIAELRLICSPSHNKTTASSPSYESMINLALQGPPPVNLSELLLDLNLSLPHMQPIRIAMTQFLTSLITGNMVDMTLQIQWSKASLKSSAPTHSCSAMFVGLMWSLKLHQLHSYRSTSGDKITSVCGVHLIVKLTASWVRTSPSCESKITRTVEASFALNVSHISLQNLKQSICRATYSARLHGTVLQSNQGNCDDKTLQIRCNDISTMIQAHLFTCSKLLIELIGFKTSWYLIVHCLYSPHNTSGEQIMCVHRVHLIGNPKLCRLSCSSSHHQTTSHFNACSSYSNKMNLTLQGSSALIGSELPLPDLEQPICVIGSLKQCRPNCSPSHHQTTFHFNACSSYLKKMNPALEGPSALIESEPPILDLEQPICSVLHLPRLHGTALHANCDSEQCRGSGDDPIIKRELGDNATSHRKSGRGNNLKLRKRKLLKSRGSSDDKKNKGSNWHLTQKAASQCGPKHLKCNSSSGAMRESRHRTEVFMSIAQYTQINNGLHQGREVEVLMSALSSANESKNAHLFSSKCSLVKLVHLSNRFLIAEARANVGFNLSTFSHFLLVGSKVLWSTIWHNARGDQMTSTLMFECCEMHLFTKPFWLASISGYHKASASFPFQPCISNARSYTRKGLALQRPKTLDTSFLDLTHQQIKVISSPQSDKSSQNTGGCCGKDGSSKKDKDSSGGDRPQDTGSGQGPPGSGGGDGDDNDNNSGKKKYEELQFEDGEEKSSEENDAHSEEKSSEEENKAHSDARQSKRPQFNPEKLWNAVKKDSLPSSRRSGSLVTPRLQSKFLSLHSGAYIFSILLQYRQKLFMSHKLEIFGAVIVHLPLKGCCLLSNSCTCVLVVCNDSLCIHLYEANMHICLRITLALTKWKEKSLKPNPSIMCEGASSYTEQSKEWLYPRKTGPQSEPGILQNVAVSFPMPVPVSEKTESLRKTRSGFIPVSTTLAPVSYHTPIAHHKRKSERPENHLAPIEQHQNVIYVPSERPPVKKRQCNIGSGQEQIELIYSQHFPQIVTAQTSLEQQEKNEVQLCPNQSTSQDLESNTQPNFAITNTLGAPAMKPFWYTTYTAYENVELKESEFSTAQQEYGLVSKTCSELVSGSHQVPPSEYNVISLFPLPIIRYETRSSASDDSQYFDAFENKSESIVETEISAHNGSELNEVFEDRNTLEVEPKCHEWEEAEEYTDVCSPYTGTGDQVCEKRDDECLEQPVECKGNGEMYPYITHHITPNKKQTFCLLSDSDFNRMTECVPESLGRGIRAFPPTISSCLEQDIGGPCMSPVQESPVKVSRHCTTLARHTASSSDSLFNVHGMVTSLQRRA